MIGFDRILSVLVKGDTSMAMIEVNNLTFTYPETSHPALDDVSFQIPKGQWVTILGPNGSGKSTLARLIDGLLPLDHGEIIVDGIPVIDANLQAIHQKIGFVFQNPDNQFVGTTVADDVAFGLENQQVPHAQMKERIQQALKAVGMTGYENKEPAYLSGGQKQRVAIAGALSLRPAILVLDEATSMLDPQGREQILKLLVQLKEKNGFTILAISHDPAEAILGDQVMIIDRSHLIAQGTTTQIMGDSDLLKRHGIGLPFTTQLKSELLKKGIAVPSEYQSEEQMVTWLNQQLSSTK